jgi:uncharacterized protein
MSAGTPEAATAVLLAQNDLLGAVVRFCRFARTRGLSAGTKEMLVCLQALKAISRFDVDSLKSMFRTVLCCSKEDWDLFDTLFAEFWLGAKPKPCSGQARSLYVRECDHSFHLLAATHSRSHGAVEDREKEVSGASAVERLRKIDFAQASEPDLTALERLARRLLRRLSYRVSRKLRSGTGRDIVDLRRTIRLNLSRGGDPVELRFKRPRRKKAKLVVLLDVSDSMSAYSLFLLQFVYVLKKEFREVAPFIFSTSLIDVGDVLKLQAWSDAAGLLSQMITGWSGGTRIGGSLKDFNRLYSDQLLSSSTVFVILSDGWDTEGPEVLVAELQKIKRRVRKLVWLNPLLGLEEYEPVTRAISAALPYIDVFAPAHNLESLLELENHLLANV